MARKGPHRYLAYEKAHEKQTLERVQARRYEAKKLGLAAIKGKDIDHKRPVRLGGTNTPSNLRLRSPHANRADKSVFTKSRPKAR